jgi:hypothetical protein
MFLMKLNQCSSYLKKIYEKPDASFTKLFFILKQNKLECLSHIIFSALLDIFGTGKEPTMLLLHFVRLWPY